MDFICRVRTGIVKQGNRACAALCNCGAVFSGRVLVANYSGYNYYIPGRQKLANCIRR